MLIETIPAALHEQRLDRVVALIADISRATTATLIELGGVTLDGDAGVAGKVKVREGQEVTIRLNDRLIILRIIVEAQCGHNVTKHREF